MHAMDGDMPNVNLSFEHLVALLGLAYGDLSSSPAFEGRSVPAAEHFEEDVYVEVKDLGFALVIPENDVVDTIQLFGAGEPGYRRYEGPLPWGLSFTMSRSEVRRVLGEPGEQRDKTTLPILGSSPAWDAYLRGGIRIHVRYSLDERSIGMISVSKAQRLPTS